MTDHLPTRRQFLATTGLAASATASLEFKAAAQTNPSTRPDDEPFGYCLNTATLSGQNLGIVKLIDIAGSAGYGAIEPWLREIDPYADAGGSLDDLRKQIVDAGLTVESAIAFAPWIVNDDAARAKGLEQMKRDMDRVAKIGGKRIAAPPIGANGSHDGDIDLHAAAERYRAICDLRRSIRRRSRSRILGAVKKSQPPRRGRDGRHRQRPSESVRAT